MPIIRILPHAEYCPEGTEVPAPAGTSICEALLDNQINIEHACDLSCACTTCHVIVREGFDSECGGGDSPLHHQPRQRKALTNAPLCDKFSWIQRPPA